MRWLMSLALWAALWAVLGPAHAGPAVQVEDAWVREGPPNATVLAAFMVLRNDGSAPVEIVAASSPRFARVELHLSRMEDGMARMVQQSALTVPASGSLELAPGGYHLMLFEPDGPIESGQRVALTLRTRNGEDIEVSAQVRRSMGGAMHQHHPHDHRH